MFFHFSDVNCLVEDDRDEGDRDQQENARREQRNEEEDDDEDELDDPENERAEDQRDLEPNDLGLYFVNTLLACTKSDTINTHLLVCMLRQL